MNWTCPRSLPPTGSRMVIALAGYLLDSANCSGIAQVGRSPWTARDAFVPLPEARASAPAPRNTASPCPPESNKYPSFPMLRFIRLTPSLLTLSKRRRQSGWIRGNRNRKLHTSGSVALLGPRAGLDRPRRPRQSRKHSEAPLAITGKKNQPPETAPEQLSAPRR